MSAHKEGVNMRSMTISLPARLFMAIGLCGILSGAALADAEDHPTADSVAKLASGKFGRGLVNVTTGWGEMIRCPMEIGHERGAFLGATWGPLKGIAMTILRTTGGLFETVLFFYPLPGNYDPFFDSEFVFSKPAAPDVAE